jgi:hypothetical protein
MAMVWKMLLINLINISDTYKPKGWSNDINAIHTAILVLRIGGPRLLYVFAQQNMLPSSSYIYKVRNFND